MARDTEKYRLFTRRALLLGGLQTGFFALLAGRIYYLQILRGEAYRTQAEDNRINLRLIAPPRGRILDRFGTPLATNQPNYRVVLLPDQTDDARALMESLNTWVPLAEADRRRVERELKRGVRNAILAHDNLTWEQVATLSLHMLELPGLDIETGEVRAYPLGDQFAHVLGYVALVSDREGTEDEPELSIPGFRVGKNGIEKRHDRHLRGTAGAIQLEVNVRGRVVRELARDPPKPGEDLSLALDAGLQAMVQKRLAAESSAAAVVMDARSGAVYALYSHPSFDPNLFAYGISQADWDALNANAYTPLLNKAVDGAYAPGSTFKMVTALAGLESGLLDPAATVYCPGHYDLGNHRFHCWKRGGHGHVNFVQGLAGSCDTYFYDLGHRVGIDRIQAMAERLGLGRKTGIDLPQERGGFVPSRAWKMASRNAAWQKGETLIAAIGQGYMLATPLQLAVMVARLVNGGRAVRPHLALRPEPEEGDSWDWPSLGLKAKHLDLVREAMAAVVNEPFGTAHGARMPDGSPGMGGKTGTAQVRRISMAERAEGVTANEELPWKERDHALFVGYAPLDAPRYVVAVVVEHGGSGAHTAAPLARDILAECLAREPEKAGGG